MSAHNCYVFFFFTIVSNHAALSRKTLIKSNKSQQVLSRYTSHQSQKVMIEYHLNPLMSCACPSWIEQVDALHLHFSNVSYRTKQIEHLVQNLQGVPKPLWCFHKASKGLGSQWPTLSLNLSNSCTRKKIELVNIVGCQLGDHHVVWTFLTLYPEENPHPHESN
jgi:iron only hydrogenase large subunit-like protein